MHRTQRSWYREPWPWLLMLAPGIAIIWGATTLWIALKYPDPLVTQHAWEDGKKLEMHAPQKIPSDKK